MSEMKPSEAPELRPNPDFQIIYSGRKQEGYTGVIVTIKPQNDAAWEVLERAGGDKFGDLELGPAPEGEDEEKWGREEAMRRLEDAKKKLNSST